MTTQMDTQRKLCHLRWNVPLDAPFTSDLPEGQQEDYQAFVHHGHSGLTHVVTFDKVHHWGDQSVTHHFEVTSYKCS